MLDVCINCSPQLPRTNWSASCGMQCCDKPEGGCYGCGEAALVKLANGKRGSRQKLF